MNYVIWGAGAKGKRLLHCLEGKHVSAFVDMDIKKIGSEIEGIPIISYERYKSDYSDDIIVVSPSGWDKPKNSVVKEDFGNINRDIKKLLIKDGIYNFFDLMNNPQELPWLDEPPPFDEMIEHAGIEREERILLIGYELFSVLLYDYLSSKNYEAAILKTGGNVYLEKYLADHSYRFVDKNEVEVKEHFKTVLLVDRKYKINLKNDFNRIVPFYDFSFLKRYRYLNIEKYRDIHVGKTCFIVCNGPSLKMNDLDLIHENKNDLISFGMNMIFVAFKSTEWRPDYYVATDTTMFDSYVDEMKQMQAKARFVADRGTADIMKHPPEGITIYHQIYPVDGEIAFSPDLRKGIGHGATVAYDCIQIAVYMGFKYIYLIGADCFYKNKVNDVGNHFSDDYAAKIENKVAVFRTDLVFSAYERARKYTDEHDIHIYNATRGGMCEVFDRVDFDSLFTDGKFTPEKAVIHLREPWYMSSKD